MRRRDVNSGKEAISVLQKWVAAWLLPPGILILALLAVVVWLWSAHRRPARGIAVLTGILYIASTPWMGDVLLRTLEREYQPPAHIAGDVIVMLGGGATLDTPNVYGLGNLSGHGGNRLITTAELYRQTRLPIVESGGQVFPDDGVEAVVAKRELVGLGVPAADIFVDDNSLNTRQNAIDTAALLHQHGWTNPILVTSAFHMPRAVLDFHTVGIAVTPYPTDYLAPAVARIYPYLFVPSGHGLSSTSLALHEWLGMLAVRYASSTSSVALAMAR